MKSLLRWAGRAIVSVMLLVFAASFTSCVVGFWHMYEVTWCPGPGTWTVSIDSDRCFSISLIYSSYYAGFSGHTHTPDATRKQSLMPFTLNQVWYPTRTGLVLGSSTLTISWWALLTFSGAWPLAVLIRTWWRRRHYRERRFPVITPEHPEPSLPGPS